MFVIPIVGKIRKISGKEAKFGDFLGFVEEEAEVLNDPVYSRGGFKEKKPEEKLKPKKTKEQTEIDIEELERKKAEEKALEEFIEDHKLPEDLGKFLDDIGSVLR